MKKPSPSPSSGNKQKDNEDEYKQPSPSSMCKSFTAQVINSVDKLLDVADMLHPNQKPQNSEQDAGLNIQSPTSGISGGGLSSAISHLKPPRPGG